MACSSSREGVLRTVIQDSFPVATDLFHIFHGIVINRIGGVLPGGLDNLEREN